MRIPGRREMQAASELMKKVRPVAQELNAALDNLAEEYERWLTAMAAGESPELPAAALSAAVKRVLAAHATDLSAL